MADVKWIKIVTDLFDDEKILLIEAMPKADSLILIWIKLLCLAGKQNNDGVLMLGNTPMDCKMLATIFRKPLSLVKNAIDVFSSLGMVVVKKNVIVIPNWNKHQSLDFYQKKLERDRIYQAKRRAEQNDKIEKSSDTSSDSRLTSSFQIRKEEKRKEKNTPKGVCVCEESGDSSQARTPRGEFSNVFLSDSEIEKLREKSSDADELIEKLSAYIESTGAQYESHYATLSYWIKGNVQEEIKNEKKKPKKKSAAEMLKGSDANGI